MGQFGVYLQHVIMVLESSKEAATNARELSEKSEAAREDPGMIAALLGYWKRLPQKSFFGRNMGH